MSRILIIGAGGVGAALARKCCQLPDTFREIILASRSRDKCESVRRRAEQAIRTAEVDAERPEELVPLLRKYSPALVINAALPAQNLPIMNACLEAGVHYLDTSAPEPDPSRYELFAYRWQLAYDRSFREKGLTGVLSLGFDPGVTNVFCAYADKYLFDEIHTVDMLDCNAGKHDQPFATNFNAATNIQEVIQKGVYWENGGWREVQPFSVRKVFNLQEIGPRKMYLIYHEELETLAERLSGLRRLRFWMHFNDRHLHHLEVLRNVGLTSLEEVDHEGIPISPLKFLQTLLPDPAGLGERYTGKTNIGCLFNGMKDGRPRTCYLYNVSDHAACYREIGSQAVSYTTAVPAMLGAKLMLEGRWQSPGVHVPEDLEPDPLLELLPRHGLPWRLAENPSMTES